MTDSNHQTVASSRLAENGVLSPREAALNDGAFRYYTLVAGIFVATLLVSNTTASKLFQLGPFFFPGGIIVFPIAYIFGDILTEVYGYARARRIIWTGFAAELLMVLTYAAVIALPPAPFWPNQAAMEVTLSQVPRVVLATMVGYFVGEFLNSYVLARMKVWTRGRHLWARTIGSTVVGEAADSVIFIVIGFAGLWRPAELLWIGVSVYIFKVAYEVLATPLTYVIVGALKRSEGIDHFDRDTRFNPFRWKE